MTSSEPGHMDFGGKGFVSLGQTLQSRGHHVTWLSFGSQVERLKKAGCIADSLPAIKGLTLMPFFIAEAIDSNKQHHQFRINSLDKIYSLLKKEQPDLLLIDRLLTYGGLAAEQLDIPYAAIGTPGGHWRFEQSNQETHALPASELVDDYHFYSESLKKTLGWEKGETGTCWTNSPYLNICFMNHDFYPVSNEQKKLLASVYHHQDMPPEKRGRRHGISFGNQGNQQHLLTLLELVVTLPDITLPIDVFVGIHEEIYQKLYAAYRPDQITLHRWVDFGEHFPDLSCLVFLGGIGTIWQCIDHGLPMLIIPGNIGDQRFNAERIQAMGVGIHLQEDDLEKDKLAAAIVQCNDNYTYRDRINELRSPRHYTDTLDSICERLEALPVS